MTPTEWDKLLHNEKAHALQAMTTSELIEFHEAWWHNEAAHVGAIPLRQWLTVTTQFKDALLEKLKQANIEPPDQHGTASCSAGEDAVKTGVIDIGRVHQMEAEIRECTAALEIRDKIIHGHEDVERDLQDAIVRLRLITRELLAEVVAPGTHSRSGLARRAREALGSTG